MGETMTMREWLKDGWVYVESAVENGEAVRTKTQVNLEEQLALLATDGMLVKRPILVGERFVKVGFREKEWEEIG